MADHQRLFVALWPDALTRNRLAQQQRMLSILTGRTEAAVASDNLHLTLRFLGDVASGDIESIKAVLSTIAFAPFELVLDTWGQFPRPGILWFGPTQQADALMDLQAEVSRACESVIRLQKEKRFRPHVTLFRKVCRLQQLEPPEAVHWLVDRLVLVQSSTRPQGVQYRIIHEVFAEQSTGLPY